MPPPVEILYKFQTLVAASFAVVAAFIGFAGVWYAQRKTFQNAERERRHREEMAQRAQGEEQDQLRMMMIVALIAELNLFHVRIEVDVARLQRIGWSTFRRDPFMARLWTTPMFDVYHDKIGLLSPSLSFDVVHTYSLIKMHQAMMDMPVSLPGDFKSAHMSTNSEKELVTGKVEAMQSLTESILNTIGRLDAVRRGEPDPG